jgi:hydrogenase maturation protein HypF
MSAAASRTAAGAVRLRITGVVQGVGFRPFVFRLAREYGVAGWVLNAADGVHVLAEGPDDVLERFVAAVRERPPPAAHVASFEAERAERSGVRGFEIRATTSGAPPTVRISPDLAVCDDCLRELFDPADRRFGYPYINCTNCGPRYSIVLALPYDRPNTTMRDWPMCAACRTEYENPADRRFHAQPIACPACGPGVRLVEAGGVMTGAAAIDRTATLLGEGAVVALKGIGGYHLACDARNVAAVTALRERKFRKERPFAVMARDASTARSLVQLGAEAHDVLLSIERPIVLAPKLVEFAGVAPGNRDLGVMLPYTPVHHLLFAAGAPAVLVLTSANRSSEPIAYRDDDALSSLAGIADAFLTGEREIARRLDDSVARSFAAPAERSLRNAPAILRRARGLAPQAVARFPKGAPVLALGGDLKNALTLVVDGQAFASQHVGDLDHLSARDAFVETARDLCAVYGVRAEDTIVAHDLHPGYRSTEYARSLPGRHVGVQHHRAHIASVLAERDAWDEPVTGFAFDGTGYGDDATVWGGEVFAGSLASGLRRVAHLRPAFLPGGDAAARFPVQAAAGFLYESDEALALEAEPFGFPERYALARQLTARGVRAFPTTSIGRLFDAVAALNGFTREQTFEGQAAMWLEHQARSSAACDAYVFPYANGELDYRPLLAAIVADRRAGRACAAIARAFHEAVADAVVAVVAAQPARRVVVSGGVFQNALLVELIAARLGERLWCNVAVPANDGGLSLGQAALAVV